MCRKNYFLNDYFVSVYDNQDNNVFNFESIENTSKFFNISLKELLIKIRNNSYIKINDNIYKFYLYKKNKFERKRNYARK